MRCKCHKDLSAFSSDVPQGGKEEEQRRLWHWRRWWIRVDINPRWTHISPLDIKTFMRSKRYAVYYQNHYLSHPRNKIIPSTSIINNSLRTCWSWHMMLNLQVQNRKCISLQNLNVFKIAVWCEIEGCGKIQVAVYLRQSSNGSFEALIIKGTRVWNETRVGESVQGKLISFTNTLFKSGGNPV